MSEKDSLNLSSTYVRLRSDALVEPLPVDETFWQGLVEGKFGSFHNEYLVTVHTFSEDWDVWEVHPNGDEVVCLISGSVTFIIETDGEHSTVALDEAGSYVIVPKSAWHTAKVNAISQVLFITAGEGTQHRKVAS